MGNFFRSFGFNTLCICITLVAFSLNVIPQVHAVEPFQMEVGLATVEELKTQIAQDIKQAKTYFK